MDIKEFSTVISSWLKIPKEDVTLILSKLKKSGLLPDSKSPLSFVGAANAMVGIMVASLNIPKRDLAEMTTAACTMLLEGPIRIDPLDILPRSVFCRLVGETLGEKSDNGYVDFSETIATAMRRSRENLGSLEVEKISFRISGTDWLGQIEARDQAGVYLFPFTHKGRFASRNGLLREVVIDKATFYGIAYLMDAEARMHHHHKEQSVEI